MVWGAIANAGANILGNLIGSSSASRGHNWDMGAMQRQYEYNLALQQQSQAWMEHMSNTAHVREMNDLKRAGLNPILTATGGQGASSPSSGASSVGLAQDGGLAVQEQANKIALAQTASNIELQRAQAAQAQATADNEQNQTYLTAAKIVGQAIDNAKQKKYLDNWDKEFIHRLEHIRSQTILNYASTNQMKSAIESSSYVNALNWEKTKTERAIRQHTRAQTVDKIVGEMPLASKWAVLGYPTYAKQRVEAMRRLGVYDD